GEASLLFEGDGEILGQTFRTLRIANQSQHPEELMRGTQEAGGGLPLALGVSGHGQVELGAPHLVSRLDAREGLEGHLEILLGLRVAPRGIGDAAETQPRPTRPHMRASSSGALTPIATD